MSKPEDSVCPYKFTDDQIVFSGKWIGVRQVDFVQHQNGKAGMWQSAFRPTTDSNAETDGVSVIATLTNSQCEKLIILVKQYRIPLNSFTLEFPAGLVDAGETAEKAALRELKEETGYTATKVDYVSASAIPLNPGLSNETHKIVQVQVDATKSENFSVEQQLEDGEFVEVVLVKKAQLMDELEQFAKRDRVKIESTLYTYALGLKSADL